MYTKHKWKSDVYHNFGYVTYLPKDFDESKSYPLVLFLHGAGERGEDLELACELGYMKYVREEGKEYPFIFVAPQCPANKYWGCYTESLIAFMDYICDTLPVDKERIYLTGLSMGGYGTWFTAMAKPELFAAIAPICGGGMAWNAKVLTMPVWAFHGAEDNIVSTVQSDEMVAKLKECSKDVTYSRIDGVGHNVWEYAYTKELMEWLLSKERTK